MSKENLEKELQLLKEFVAVREDFIKDLQSKLNVAIDVLEFYATEDNYFDTVQVPLYSDKFSTSEDMTVVNEDGGEKARLAIKEIKE
jgi:predicted KAP-like P-loop ATPase